MEYLFLITAAITALSFLISIVMGILGFWDESWPIRMIGHSGAIAVSLIAYSLSIS